MSAATTPSSGTAGGGGAGAGPPPLPPTKPVLSSPGAYMANYNSGGGGGGGSGSATAGIHSVNKQYAEKPAIAARPVPPPTLPKYTSSFGKIDRAEREKVCVLLQPWRMRNVMLSSLLVIMCLSLESETVMLECVHCRSD